MSANASASAKPKKKRKKRRHSKRKKRQKKEKARKATQFSKENNKYREFLRHNFSGDPSAATCVLERSKKRIWLDLYFIMSAKKKGERLRKKARYRKTKVDANTRTVRAWRRDIKSAQRELERLQALLVKDGKNPVAMESLMDATALSIKKIKSVDDRLEAIGLHTSSVSDQLGELRRDNEEAQRALMEPIINYVQRAPHSLFAKEEWNENLLHVSYYQTSGINTVRKQGRAPIDPSGYEHVLPTSADLYMSAKQRNMEPEMRLTGSKREQGHQDRSSRKAAENKTKTRTYVKRRALENAQKVPSAATKNAALLDELDKLV